MLILHKVYVTIRLYINRINGIIMPVDLSGFIWSVWSDAAFGSGN